MCGGGLAVAVALATNHPHRLALLHLLCIKVLGEGGGGVLHLHCIMVVREGRGPAIPSVLPPPPHSALPCPPRPPPGPLHCSAAYPILSTL